MCADILTLLIFAKCSHVTTAMLIGSGSVVVSNI